MKLAVQLLLSRREVRPRDVEQALGHCTFIVLLSRETLSVFNSVYAFVSRLRHLDSVRLWPSVRWELSTFVALLPLVFRDFRKAWSPKVLCTDASYWGFGAVSKRMGEEVAASMGQYSERWRMSSSSAAASRQWAGVDGGGDINEAGEGVVEECNESRAAAAGSLSAAVRERGWSVIA